MTHDKVSDFSRFRQQQNLLTEDIRKEIEKKGTFSASFSADRMEILQKNPPRYDDYSTNEISGKFIIGFEPKPSLLIYIVRRQTLPNTNHIY